MPPIEVPLAAGGQVVINGLKSKPHLNFQKGRIERWEASSGRWRVKLNDGAVVGVKPENLQAPVQLTPEGRAAPWENCRHGGPELGPGAMQFVHRFLTSTVFQTCTAPCLGHARELEPIIRMGAPPAIVLASMGVDAFIADDFGPSRSFAVAALVLESAKAAGTDELFRELRVDLQHMERREQLVARWTIGRCALCLQTMETAAFEDLGRYACSHCGKSEGDAPMLECSKCTLVRYCNAECQEAHWPVHKAACKAARKTAREPEVVLSCGHVLHRACLNNLCAKEKENGCSAGDTPPCPYCNRPLSSTLEKLQAKLHECADGVSGLRRTLARFTTCNCLALAGAIGRQPASREPPSTPADATWEGRSPPAAPQPGALQAGRRLGALATTLLRMTSHKQPPCLRLREDASKLLQAPTQEAAATRDRAACREHLLFSFEARAEAGDHVMRQGALDTMYASCEAALTLLEGSRASAAPQNVRPGSRKSVAVDFLRAAESTLLPPGGNAGLVEGSDEYEALLLAMEVLAQVGGTSLGLGAISGGVAAQLCRIITVGSSRVPLHVTHNAMRTLMEVLMATPPDAWVGPLEAELLLVCNELDRMLHDFLSDDPLSTACIDTPLMLTALLTGGSASCAQRIASSMLPTSAALVVFHHAHEQRAGRKAAGHPLGELQHLQPINLALEALYVMSLRFDVRSVPIGGDGDETERFADAFEEYADYLHGVFHHCHGGPQQRAYLARLRERSASRVKKNQAKAFETSIEQMRRQHAMFYKCTSSSMESSVTEAFAGASLS